MTYDQCFTDNIGKDQYFKHKLLTIPFVKKHYHHKKSFQAWCKEKQYVNSANGSRNLVDETRLTFGNS